MLLLVLLWSINLLSLYAKGDRLCWTELEQKGESVEQEKLPKDDCQRRNDDDEDECVKPQQEGQNTIQNRLLN